MKLRTEIDIKPYERGIGYSDRLFMIGSCFAQNIGERAVRAKFSATVNPTGTLFNPLSICDTIERLYDTRLVEEAELHEGDQGWYHYDFHSSLNCDSRRATAASINRAIVEGGEALRAASSVVITLGTAWVYSRDGEMGAVVANCHKEPARNFTRRRATAHEIAERLTEVIDRCLAGRHIIVTISPIRHLADGLAENSLSKATLRLAVEMVLSQRAEVRYFPSYEIMMDDLRDYRFYCDDMTHPTPLAVEYIWDRFCEAALSDRARELMPRVMKVVRAAEHRALNPRSEAHRAHCEAQLRAIDQLGEVDFSKESAYFCEQLEINL